MDRELIKLFEDSRVPRYTSYPTAPHFKSDLAPIDHQSMLESIDPDQPLSLYLHVPFCHQLCWYCGCTTKVVNNSRPIERYTGLLKRHLALVAANLDSRPRLGHIHWGGGTPSIVGGADFEELMRLIGESFPIRPDAEIAVELDPRHLDADMVAAMTVSGVNRISFGVQSFDAQVQAAINRVQPFRQVQRCVYSLRRAGIDDISFDLLYGLPHQNRQSCLETVKQALVLNPQRLSVFAYAHLPKRIKHQQLISDEALPGAAERVAQFEVIRDQLVEAGYIPIGIDHFALPHDPLAIAAQNGTLRRNFQGYTTDQCDQLIGIGASAISSTPKGYMQNHVNIAAYSFDLLSDQLPIARGLRVNHEDLCRRAIIERIMCSGEVDLREISQQFGIATSALEPQPGRIDRLLACGLVERDGYRYRMMAKRLHFARLLGACFDSYLDPQTAMHSTAL